MFKLTYFRNQNEMLPPRSDLQIPQGSMRIRIRTLKPLVKRGKRKGLADYYPGLFLTHRLAALWHHFMGPYFVLTSHTQVQVCNVHLKYPPCFKLSILVWLAQYGIGQWFCIGLIALICRVFLLQSSLFLYSFGLVNLAWQMFRIVFFVCSSLFCVLLVSLFFFFLV